MALIILHLYSNTLYARHAEWHVVILYVYPNILYSRYTVWYIAASSKGVTANLSRCAVKNLRQEGDNPPMKESLAQKKKVSTISD